MGYWLWVIEGALQRKEGTQPRRQNRRAPDLNGDEGLWTSDCKIMDNEMKVGSFCKGDWMF